jgi:hypothetical protein
VSIILASTQPHILTMRPPLLGAQPLRAVKQGVVTGVASAHIQRVVLLRGGGLDGVMADMTISLVVLLGVAVAARSGSSTVSAIFSTAPTGVPLSLWLVHRAAEAGISRGIAIEAFLWAVIKGGISLSAFALGALGLMRCGPPGETPALAALLGAGFTSWGVAMWSLLKYV